MNIRQTEKIRKMLSRAARFAGVLGRTGFHKGFPAPAFTSSIRLFSSSNSLQFKVQEAVQDFINLRREELEQYEAVDEADKEETIKLIQQLKESSVTEATTWSALGLDGLDEVELVLAIEQALGVTLPDDEFHTIRSIPDAIAVFAKYTPKQG